MSDAVTSEKKIMARTMTGSSPAGIDGDAHPNSASGLVETGTSVAASAEHVAEDERGHGPVDEGGAEKLLRGKAWVGGEHIYAFDLIQQKHWTDPLSLELNSKYVMAGVDPAFAGWRRLR